jgi:NADH-quinone oxidoreductase subunit J
VTLQLAFAAVCAVTFFSAVRVVATSNLVRAVFWLALSLLGTAVLYALLEAPFLAGVQVLTYVGGVVTLMVFGVMVTRQHDGSAVVAESADQGRAALISGGLVVLMGMAIWKTPDLATTPAAHQATTAELARSLLGQHLVAFEVASLLLLAAIIGAVVLARKKDPDPLTRREPLPRLSQQREDRAS